MDVALVLHAEHGGGNNSTFTTHVVSSSGTDTYSAIAASLGSLKGPKHGGANIRLCKCSMTLKEMYPTGPMKMPCEVIWAILDKKAFDKSGLIYGMGHAVYSYLIPGLRSKRYGKKIK